MRRYFLMAIASIFSCALLIYFYLEGERELAKSNHDVLTLIQYAKRVDAQLEKDILKAKEFSSQSYDSLVSNAEDAESVCAAFKDPRLSLYRKTIAAIDILIDRYCTENEAKLHHVETFKSLNSVLRNSIYFVHEASLPEKIDGLGRRIITASLSFVTLASHDAGAKLVSVIREAELLEQKKALPPDLRLLVLHARKILNIKREIDALAEQVVLSPSGVTLDEMRKQYVELSTEADKSASKFRVDVLAICISFFLFSIYSILSLWRQARSLSEVNRTLEHRVSERTKELEESKRKVLEQQQALISSSKMSALGEMAGGVAHEINTPLSVIGMRVEQMEECINDGEFDALEFLDSIAAIRKTVDRIAKIVNGLRFFAREGKRDSAQRVKVSHLIHETLSLCQERFASHGVQLILPEEDLALSSEVECHSIELSQVLLNLLNNAYDAIEGMPEKWIKIESLEGRDHVEIWVTDCGHGIPKDIQEKIMEPFFTTKEIGKGTGLGLSLSKGIIEGHHGKLYVDNQCPNTKFVIWLPKFQPVQNAQGTAA